MGGGTGNILQQEVGLGKDWQLGKREQLTLNQQEKGANTEDKNTLQRESTTAPPNA